MKAKLLLLATCVTVAAVGVSGQIITLPVPVIKVPKPTPTPVGTTIPSTVKTPTTIATTGPGPSAETEAAFRKDAQPYVTAINQLYGYENVKEWDPRPNVEGLRTTLAEVEALGELIRTKYPGINNANRCSQFACKYGEWRRLAENRMQIAQAYVNKSFGFSMKDNVKEINKTRADIKIKQGFVLSRSFDDKTARIPINDEWKGKFALVGLQTPDESAVAEYSAAYDALIEAAKLEAPNWVFPSPYHDAMIEGKARGWFKDWEPKGTIVKIGTYHDAWEITKHSNGLINGRYKRGYILYKKPGVEQCITVGFSYEQNYMGNGRYNAMAITSGMHQSGLRLQSCDK